MLYSKLIALTSNSTVMKQTCHVAVYFAMFTLYSEKNKRFDCNIVLLLAVYLLYILLYSLFIYYIYIYIYICVCVFMILYNHIHDC